MTAALDRWRRELEALVDLGRLGAAFDHAQRLADEGSPFARVLARRWLRDLAPSLRPVHLHAFRLDALDRHCDGLRPADGPRVGGRAWFPAVFPRGARELPEACEPGALGQVIARVGRPGIEGTLAPDARQAVEETLELLRERGLLPDPVSLVVRAPGAVTRTSLQLAVAAAALSAVENLPPLDDIACTGALDPEGRVLPVGQVPEKRRILDEEWPGALLMVPPDEASTPGTIPVDHLDSLVAHLRGRPEVGWDRTSDPDAARREVESLGNRGRYVEASRLAWSLARAEPLRVPPEVLVTVLTAQLNEANNTGAQARAMRLAVALDEALLTCASSPERRADAMSALARHDSALFRLESARRRSEEALGLDLGPITRVRRLRALARVCAEDLDLPRAVALVEEALQVDGAEGERVRSLLELGEWWRRRGELERALGLAGVAARQVARGDDRSADFVWLLRARVALDQGEPSRALAEVGRARGVHASPGIELAEVRVRALVGSGRRDEAARAFDRAVDRYHGPFAGSVVARMLKLRTELALARGEDEARAVRRRIWRLPGFADAYRGRLADRNEVLLRETPY